MERVKDAVSNFIAGGNGTGERVIVIPKGFDGYASATAILAIEEVRKNLVRAGAAEMGIPGNPPEIKVADDVNSAFENIDPGAMVIAVGYDYNMYGVDLNRVPPHTAILFSYRDLNGPCRIDETNNAVKAVFRNAAVYEQLVMMFDLTDASPTIFFGNCTNEAMAYDYLTPFTKRIANWFTNCYGARTGAVKSYSHLVGGWYKFPMTAKEYLGYAAFASGPWPDIDVIRERAKSLADIMTGSDVFLRIDARAQMEREHISEIVESMRRSQECGVINIGIDVPVTPVEMAAISTMELETNRAEGILFQTRDGEYMFDTIRTDVIDGMSMIPCVSRGSVRKRQGV